LIFLTVFFLWLLLYVHDWVLVQILYYNDNGLTEGHTLKDYPDIYIKLLEDQRGLLNKINHHAKFDEELIRKHLR
jgi:hypothetical protein